MDVRFEVELLSMDRQYCPQPGLSPLQVVVPSRMIDVMPGSYRSVHDDADNARTVRYIHVYGEVDQGMQKPGYMMANKLVDGEVVGTFSSERRNMSDVQPRPCQHTVQHTEA